MNKPVLLYRTDSKHPVKCHPSKVEDMKKRGWSEDKPIGKKSSIPTDKPAEETKL